MTETTFPEAGVSAMSRWIFNCYVVHDGGEGRPFAVDVGLPSHAARLGGRDLPLVLATHGHSDHVGGLPALRKRATVAVGLPAGIRALRDGAPVRTPGPKDIAHILPVMRDQPFSLAALRELAPVAKEIGYGQGAVRFPFEPDQWLEDGVGVAGAPDWEVLHTPGHTDDSVSFYNASTRTLISGDAVLSVGGKAWFNPEYVDADLSARTEDRLRSLDVEHLFPGHGRPVTGPKVMAEALSFRERPTDDGIVASVRRLFRSHR